LVRINFFFFFSREDVADMRVAARAPSGPNCFVRLGNAIIGVPGAEQFPVTFQAIIGFQCADDGTSTQSSTQLAALIALATKLERSKSVVGSRTAVSSQVDQTTNGSQMHAIPV